MVQLPNNCRRSEFHVFPSNWKTASAKLSDTWYVQLYFIDPKHMDKYPKGKQIRLKAGINRYDKITDRRAGIKELMAIYEKLFNEGYNPITKVQPKSPEQDYTTLAAVAEHTPFIAALRFSLSKSSYVRETMRDVKSALNSLEKAAQTLGFMMIPISEIQTKHIKLCLDECQSSNPNFSAKRFNKVKAYVSALYSYLSEVGAVYGNVAIGIKNKIEEPTEPIEVNQTDIDRIKEHLWKNNRSLYKFMMIFYWSGGRFKELYRLKGRKVNLEEQTYSTQIIKGKKRDWVPRTIRDVALPYWKYQMQNCGKDDYVFSKDLLPGPVHIDSHQITKRWTRWVKKPLGIQWGFYKLKTLSSDRTNARAGSKVAAGQMGHTSTRMAEEIYQIEEQKRIHETLKGLDIPL